MRRKQGDDALKLCKDIFPSSWQGPHPLWGIFQSAPKGPALSVLGSFRDTASPTSLALATGRALKHSEGPFSCFSSSPPFSLLLFLAAGQLEMRRDEPPRALLSLAASGPIPDLIPAQAASLCGIEASTTWMTLSARDLQRRCWQGGGGATESRRVGAREPGLPALLPSVSCSWACMLGTGVAGSWLLAAGVLLLVQGWRGRLWMARSRVWVEAEGRRDWVSCANVTGISWDFQRPNGNSLQRGLFLALSGTAWDLLGVVLLVVIGEKFVSKSLPRTPKWKQAKGQGEWRMFFSNTFLKECVQVCSLDFVSLEFGVNLNRAGWGPTFAP